MEEDGGLKNYTRGETRILDWLGLGDGPIEGEWKVQSKSSP